MTGINPILVTFAGVILLGLPGIEIIQKKDLDAVDWDTLRIPVKLDTDSDSNWTASPV
ncbi:sodium/sulfate symporter [Calderihabitans maritimus]|uniref:Sodium/sulfate symporter n=1 Tax=Calderihabitans maritimus TaxID=1246530 RepID=A0A1Z5HSD9_9FIRM|nr:sodium/sulfate symporter [Calderihabitans maritimus]